MSPRVQVRGGYQDSMSSNTELGVAVRAACDELEALGQMVRGRIPSCGTLWKQAVVERLMLNASA